MIEWEETAMLELAREDEETKMEKEEEVIEVKCEEEKEGTKRKG